MSEKIVVPVLGESITEATVSKWLKSEGESVEADEPIVELETDKVNLEVPSPISGVLTENKFKGWNSSRSWSFAWFCIRKWLWCC
jgi:pyruvate/2-oxoglutarate dehydrogenase complex dihydrolipoamide acyltransferase (E2) component